MKKLSTTLVISALFAAGSAHAALIQFENYAPVGSLTNVGTYTEAEFTFTAVPNNAAVFDSSFSGLFPGDSTSFLGFAGTDYSGGAALITMSGTAPFNLNSLLVGGFNYAGGTGTSTVTIVGNIQGGGTESVVLQNLTGATLETINWTNLVNVQFSGSSTTAMDNVNVSAVPEPGTYGMMLGGLGLIGFMVSRKRSA